MHNKAEDKMTNKQTMLMVVPILATPLFCFIALHSNVYLVPVICILPAYPVMVYALKIGRRNIAILLMVLWALLLGMSMTVWIYKYPETAKYSILNGEKYKKEMIEWVLTGVGKEGNPMQFIPVHIVELVAFIILSLLSGSIVSILMGVVLINYMAYYVAHLAAMGHSSAFFVLGWHPWSVLRIIAYILMGVILSEPFISRIFHYKYQFTQARKLLKIALCLWVLDMIVKALFASTWREILQSLL
jgi:hypothetical protein